MKGLFITGSDTNVGKTWVSKRLIETLSQQGVDVVPRKPVESGWPSDETQSDAWLLANAANKSQQLDKVCPNRFNAPISPDRAATLEAKSLTIETLTNQCLAKLNNNQFLVVEGAGGFYSPLCRDGLNADLAERLNLPILLVVNNRLGCINHTLLTIEALEKRQLRLLAVILNEAEQASFKQAEAMDNYSDLEKLIQYPVISIAHDQHSDKPFKALSMLCI